MERSVWRCGKKGFVGDFVNSKFCFFLRRCNQFIIPNCVMTGYFFLCHISSFETTFIKPQRKVPAEKRETSVPAS